MSAAANQDPELHFSALPPLADGDELDADGHAVAGARARASDPANALPDALLRALVWLCRHHGRERSPHALLDGLAVNGVLTPDQAVKVMTTAGFNCQLIERPLGEIHGLLLPVVLLLRNEDACILVQRLSEDVVPGAGEALYDVIMTGSDDLRCTAKESELWAEYSGFALVATPALNSSSIDDEDLVDPAKHWLWGTLRRFIPYYRGALLAALISNLMMLATGLFTSVVYDKVIPHQAIVTLWALAAGAGLATLFDLAARQLRSHLIDLAGRKADMALGSLLFRQTLGLRLEHRPDSAGSFAHHQAQIEMVRDFFASATLSAISDLPFIIVFVVMTGFIGGPLVWVPVVAIPVLLLFAWILQATMRRSAATQMRQQADQQGVLVEAVEGLEDLKAAGAQGRFLQRYEEATVLAAQAALRSRNTSAWINNITASAQQIVTVVMLVWGVHLIKDGIITSGALIGAIMFSGRALGPLSSVVGLASRYHAARAAMLALDRHMRLPIERDEQRQYLPTPTIDGSLGLQEVGFAYPKTDPDSAPREVLKGITLRIVAGERIAILGRIGSGKSTILRLLAGLYQPTSGYVEAGGIDLRQIDPADYRAAIGFLSQEPRLFKGSLRDNVLLGRANANASFLMDVSRLTGLHRVAAAHPMGYDMPVGEMGNLLSGGQRQLVALTRCLVTRPQILLMDEPTSSMDAQSENMFINQLEAAIGNRTLVVVTHRPALLKLVNRVVVVDNGRILMDGPKSLVLAALAGKRPPSGAPGTPGVPMPGSPAAGQPQAAMRPMQAPMQAPMQGPMQGPMHAPMQGAPQAAASAPMSAPMSAAAAAAAYRAAAARPPANANGAPTHPPNSMPTSAPNPGAHAPPPTLFDAVATSTNVRLHPSAQPISGGETLV